MKNIGHRQLYSGMFVGALLLLWLRVDGIVYSQLIDNGDGTITDPKKGLMWLKDPTADMDWETARAWAQNLSIGGHQDWRLPSGASPDGRVCNSRVGGSNCTEAEFWSLYGGYRLIWWDPAPFGEMVREYWTGTEWPSDRNNAMAQDMEDGGQNDEAKANRLGAWAVRTIPGGATPVPIDVWIKDCDTDDGSTPSSWTGWWTSPDIYIDNNGDSVRDAPVYGADNTLKAIVRNRSSAWAMNVQVNFYYRNSSTGLVFPDGANFIGRDFVKIPPNGSAIASTLWRRVPPKPSDGHWYIGVVLYHEDDSPHSPTVTPPEDNNVAVANIWVTAHGAMQVAAGTNGPWIVTDDGAIYEYHGSVWTPKEPPGTAVDLALSGTFLTILTKPDAQGKHTVKSRHIYENTWTTYPPIGTVDVRQVACDGYEPVVLTTTTDMAVCKYYKKTQSWRQIHSGATEISVMNGRLFYLYPTTTWGNVWSRDVDGGLYTHWGENFIAHKIAGDANGYPWVATSDTSNPLWKWSTQYKKWTFGFNSGPVYEMDIESYVRMYILSDPQIGGGGYTLYSHELYWGGWTTHSLPSY